MKSSPLGKVQYPWKVVLMSHDFLEARLVVLLGKVNGNPNNYSTCSLPVREKD